jgi:hypothetical protein
MAYIPQFVPTNIEALQGTLNQYQQASDLETNRQNQVNDTYSALPTTRTYDTAMKSQTMDQFSKVREDLDKKYNYDRSNTQYAKDLAREITKLRGNPLWAHIQQKDEVDKMRKELIANKGADYIENFNPNDLTLENAKKIQDWKPMDLKDVKMNAALKAKEYSTSFMGTDISKPLPGVIQYIDKWGAKDEKEAAAYIAQHPEELDASIPEGFDKSDPRVRQAAANAWISNAIGERRPSRDNDIAFDRTGRGAAPSPISSPLYIGDQSPTVVPYAADNLKKIKLVDKKISDINTQLSKDPSNPTLIEEVQKLQKDKDEIIGVKQNIESLPNNKKIIDAGHKLINDELNQYKSFISGDKSQEIYDVLLPWFSETRDISKSNLNPVSDNTKNDVIAKVTNILSSYSDPNRKVPSNAIASISKDIFNKMALWYNGTHNYFGSGYKDNIENKINETLKAGKQPKYAESISTDDKIKDIVIHSLQNTTPLEPELLQGGKSGILWKKGVTDKLKLQFTDPTTEVSYLFDNEDDALIRLHNPGSDKNSPATATVRFDPSIMGYDVSQDLARRTGEPRFMSKIYKSFDIAQGKEYSLQNNSKYLSNVLGKFFKDKNGNPDIAMFKDFRIKKVEDPISGQIVYAVYIGENDTKPDIFQNKQKLIDELARARADYNNSTQ